MAFHSIILRQIVAFLPRYEFESLAKIIIWAKSSGLSTVAQFMIMFIGQLPGRKSLRNQVMNVSAQANKLYNLAIKPVPGPP